MLRTLRTLVRGDHERAFYECRHCGTTVDAPGEQCPHCGTAEIAQFMV